MKSEIFTILILIFGLCPSIIAQDIQLNVIGNLGSVPEQMDMSQLRSIFKGEKFRWDDGTAVKIALMKTSTPVGSYTSQKIYNMSPNELNKHFLALVFQGKVKAPVFFTSENELVNYVARTPGAIGVSQNISDSDIRIVIVNGKRQL
jgi:ABC-type phosphate transport system substrate-binding protein